MNLLECEPFGAYKYRSNCGAYLRVRQYRSIRLLRCSTPSARSGISTPWNEDSSSLRPGGKREERWSFKQIWEERFFLKWKT